TQSAEHFKNMKALFYLDPSSVQSFEDLLMDNYSDEDAFQLTVLAMVKSERSENHQYLLEQILQNQGVSSERKEITYGLLGLSNSPSSELATAILNRAESESDPMLTHAAWLCTTNLGRSLGENQKTTKAKIAVRLLAKHRADEEVEQKSLTLQAAGNLGDTKLLPVIKESIESPKSPNTLKQTGLLSLRFLESDTAQGILKKHLNSDIDPVLVGSALEALGFVNWNDDLLAHVLDQSQNAKKDDLRLSLLYLLKRKWSVAPLQIKAIFEQSSKRDPSGQIQSFARETLRQI
ncbi:hypothetical protein N9D31_04310, partial [Oligoflexaceae bacterium]|nr:hypothetical protein [Oligoflexaceae bacterium]